MTQYDIIHFERGGKMDKSKISREDVGRRIKEIRIKKDLNLEQFADKIESGKSNVSKWERGKNLPNDLTLKRIAELGGVSVEYLLYGTPEMYVFSNFENLLPAGKEYLYSITNIGQIKQIGEAIADRNIFLSDFHAIEMTFLEFVPEIEKAFLKKIDMYVESIRNKSEHINEMLEYLKNDSVMADYYVKFTDSKDFLVHLDSLSNKSIKEKAEFFNYLEGYIDSYDYVIQEGYLKETFSKYCEDWHDFLSYSKANNKIDVQLLKKRIVYKNSIGLPHFEESILVSVSPYENRLVLLPIYEEDIIFKHFINKKCIILIDEKPYIGTLLKNSLIEEKSSNAIELNNKKFIAPILAEFY